MDSAIIQMLEDYKLESRADFENALKEIMQEIALLGLWRAKFYEHALFYGGTALRILHGLPRFSEDLDFSLLLPNEDFDLSEYHEAIKTELESFGLSVTVEAKEKTNDSQVESAFIKASTKIHFMKISAPVEIQKHIQSNQTLKIKIELDTLPPGGHGVEVIDLFRPIPFQVKTMPMPDLFAGKCHALLARNWKGRVKGRDFFDYLWYLGKKTPVHLDHLRERLIQSGHWDNDKPFTEKACRALFIQRFQNLDLKQAKLDVQPFLGMREKQSLDLWNEEYFLKSMERLRFI